MSASNYFSIHGSVPNRAVAGNSHLCEDLQQHMITKCQNIRGEIVIPSSFDDFSGYDGQAVKTFNGLSCAFKFGSEVDQAGAKFFEEFSEYNEEKKKSSG